MTPSDTIIEYKVSSFLCLHNYISKNLLLPNVDTFNVLRNKGDDDVNLGKTLFVASTTDGMWIHHAQDRSSSANSSKPNIRFAGSPILLHWEGHNSSIRSVIEVQEYLMGKQVS